MDSDIVRFPWNESIQIAFHILCKYGKIIKVRNEWIDNLEPHGGSMCKYCGNIMKVGYDISAGEPYCDCFGKMTMCPSCCEKVIIAFENVKTNHLEKYKQYRMLFHDNMIEDIFIGAKKLYIEIIKYEESLISEKFKRILDERIQK